MPVREGEAGDVDWKQVPVGRDGGKHDQGVTSRGHSILPDLASFFPLKQFFLIFFF